MNEEALQANSMRSDEAVKRTFFVSGRVQGVGFRYWTKSQALELGLIGFARNLVDGRVEVVAQGSIKAVEELESRLRERPSDHRRPGSVTAVVTHEGALRGDLAGFREL